MRIVVTGGTGFLGRHIVWRLDRDGFDVTFTGRNRLAAKEVLKATSRRVTFRPVDFGSIDSTIILDHVIRGAHAVVHAGALSSPWGSRSLFERSNVVSTRDVVASCNQHNVGKLVFISSPTIYCERRNRLNIREDEPLPAPMTLYADSKLRAEKIIRESANAETAIIRPRAVFGPWDTVLLPRLLRVAQSRPIPLVNGGNAVLDVTYVENVVDAVMLALTKRLVTRVREFNVSNGEPISFATLVTEIAKAFQIHIRTRQMKFFVLDSVARILETLSKLSSNREPLMTRYGAAVISFSQTLSLERVKAELGYSAKVGVVEGLERHAAWSRNPS